GRRRAALAPSSPAPTGQNRLVRSDLVLVYHERGQVPDRVVERPSRTVVLLRQPVDPCRSMLARDLVDNLEQSTGHSCAPAGSVDEQILEIAIRAFGPRAGMKDQMREAECMPSRVNRQQPDQSAIALA